MSSPASALKRENVLYEKEGFDCLFVTDQTRPKVLNATERENHFRIAITRSEDGPRRFRGAWSRLHGSGGEVVCGWRGTSADMANDTSAHGGRK